VHMHMSSARHKSAHKAWLAFDTAAHVCDGMNGLSWQMNRADLSWQMNRAR